MAVNNARTSATTNAGERGLVITCIFDASRELVRKAWADPECVKRWWGPKGFTAPVCKIALRVGRKFLYCMRSADGKDYWNTGVYREIVEPERIVSTDSFSDEEGNPVPAPRLATRNAGTAGRSRTMGSQLSPRSIRRKDCSPQVSKPQGLVAQLRQVRDESAS
jgi:uncharacterized protein YndB with AHSA1/START domain